MRILFFLVPLLAFLTACEKDRDQTFVDIYPIHFEFNDIGLESKTVAEILDGGDYEVLSEMDYGPNLSWILDENNPLFQFLEEEFGQSLVVDNIHFLSDTKMRIVTEFENEVFDTTFIYSRLNDGYLLNEGDTLPFTFDGRDLAYCARLELIFADPTRVPGAGFVLDNCFFNTSDPEMRIQQLISNNNLIKGDTVAVANFEMQYQRK